MSHTGASSSGKTRVFGTRIRRFESSRPSQMLENILKEEGETGVDHLRIFSGNSNIPLAKEICEILDSPLGQANVRNFSDGEIQVDIDESVRGMDVFVVQSTCMPGNTNLMELLIMIDALKRASASRRTTCPASGERMSAGRTARPLRVAMAPHRQS